MFEVTNTGFQVACYLRGTRISTPTDGQDIELLAVGDLVLTESGEEQPIVWIGHRHVDCRHHPHPHHVWPVRVWKGAFAASIPHNDLMLSPDHAVFVDGVLVPIRYLINGRTIVQEQVDEVTSRHVELPYHDVILAERLPCESYLDTGNREAFENVGTRTMASVYPTLKALQANPK